MTTTTASTAITTAELNKTEPHLRDLSITIDGLNVLDIQVGGAGAWAPRLTVQLSGDQGLDDNTNGRKVFLNASGFLRSALFNNSVTKNTADVKVNHNFVPHANVSREDLDGDIKRALSLANSAIEGLEEAYHTAGNGPDELVYVNGSLLIKVTQVDFDLEEKKLGLKVDGNNISIDGLDVRNTTVFRDGEQQPQ
jgi:hypothetical protein